MTDAAIVEDVEIVGTNVAGRSSPFSWSAAIAGAIAATAVIFIIIALGTGIGLSMTSPFGNGPSATALTVAAAVWLVMAQAIGFACGGYLAARLRSHFTDSVGGETKFRDGAQGFLSWALVVFVAALISAATGAIAFGGVARVTSEVAAGTAGLDASGPGRGANTGGANTASTGTVDYFVDMLFRAAPGSAATAGSPATTTGQAAPPADAAGQRAEVTRIVLRSISQNQLNGDDRDYLAQVVTERTGLSQQDAVARVNDVQGKAIDDAKQIADKAAKAGAYLSFWTFMSLLVGAVAALLGGILGGELRDEEYTDTSALAGS